MVHAKRTTAGEELTKSEKLLKVAAQFLSRRDFTTCRLLALKAQESDPEVPGADQILAIADVLIASGREYPTDWCSVLQIPRPGSENPVLVRTQFEKLRALLAPSKNRFAFSQEAFELVHKAWSFLSYPGQKTHLGNGSESGSENGSENGPKTPKQRGKEEEVEVENGGDTFWTVCPYCYNIYEYKKMYEDCCLRCQCCRNAFQGLPIEAPKPSIMVPGKEQYYFSFGCVKMEYGEPEEEKKAKGINKEDEGFMVISDSDDDGGDGGGGSGSMGADSGNAEKTVEGVVRNGSQGGGGSGRRTPAKRVKKKAGRRKRTNLKSVAMRNTKMVMGDGMSSWRIGLEGVGTSVDGGIGIGEGGTGSGNGNGELEFLHGDDDVFAGIDDFWVGGVDATEDLW